MQNNIKQIFSIIIYGLLKVLVFSQRHFPKGNFPSDNFQNENIPKGYFSKGYVGPSEALQASRGAERCGFGKL